MSDLTLQQVVLRIGAVLLIAAVHGGTLASLACFLGDPGPRHDGRAGLGPWRHLDLIGGLLMVVFTLGWIRPIAIDPTQLRPGRAAVPIIILGASAATLALAILSRLIRPYVLSLLPDTAAATFFIFIETLDQLCVSFTLFNLLPIPLLTGQHWLEAAQPMWRATITRMQPWCIVPLALFIATGAAAWLLAPALILGD